jgi:hypothetical protein
MTTIYNVQSVYSFLVDKTVEFLGRKTYPSAVATVWSSSGSDVELSADGLSATIRKTYTRPITIDKVQLVTQLENGDRYIDLFKVVVFQAPFEIVLPPQIMLLTGDYSDSSPRTVRYSFPCPPTLLSAVVISVFALPLPGSPIFGFPMPVPPVVTAVFGLPYVTVDVTMGSEYILVANVQTVLYDPFYGIIAGDVQEVRVSAHMCDYRVDGHPVLPFAIHMMSYDVEARAPILQRLIKTPLNPLTILNESNIQSFMGASNVVNTNEYYAKTTDEIVTTLGYRLENEPTARAASDGSFAKFFLKNRSVNDVRLCITRSLNMTFGFDGSARTIRNDISMMRTLGFTESFYESVVDLTSGDPTVLAPQPFLRVTPPIIALDCTLVTTQLEGMINQSESMRLYNFTMGTERSGYTRFLATNTQPIRKLPPMYKRVAKLTFRFTCNRLQEISDSFDTEVPVRFVEPYYVTFKLEFRMPGTTDMSHSYITITGTEYEKTVNLEHALDGLATIEMMEANIPASAEAVINPGRSLVLGYIIDNSL